jgi:hypothetical protein
VSLGDMWFLRRRAKQWEKIIYFKIYCY